MGPGRDCWCHRIGAPPGPAHTALTLPDPKAHVSLPDAPGPSGVCVSLARKSQRRFGSAGSRWKVAATRNGRKWKSGKRRDYVWRHNERAESFRNEASQSSLNGRIGSLGRFYEGRLLWERTGDSAEIPEISDEAISNFQA